MLIHPLQEPRKKNNKEIKKKKKTNKNHASAFISQMMQDGAMGGEENQTSLYVFGEGK